MGRGWQRGVLWMAALSALLGWAGTACADEPFQVDTSSRLSYPLRLPADHYSIAVTYDAARYILSSVTMQPTSNGPGGAPLAPNEDATVALDNEATPGHAVLEIKPRAPSFRFPGEYRIALGLTGHALDAASRPVSSSAILSITRLEPQIDIESMSGKSTTLYRLFPWMAASGSIQYPLQIGRSSDAAELSVAPLGLNWANNLELVPDAMLAVSPSHLNLQPGRPQNVVVDFSSLAYAGDFQTTLAFDSDSLVKRHTIAIAVRVKDSVWMPLAVILLGVFGGVAVTWLSGDRREMLQIRYRLSELRLRLQKLAPAIVTPDSAAQYQHISNRIDAIQRNLRVERVEDGNLTAVTDELAALEKLLATTHAAVGGTLDRLDAETEALDTALAPELPDIVERTQPIAARIAAIRAMNRGGQYEYAAQQAAGTEKQLVNVSQVARAAVVEDLSLQVSAHLHSGLDKNLAGKFNELRQLAAAGSLDDFMTALTALRQELQHTGFSMPTRAVAARAGAVTPGQPDYQLVVRTGQRARITGQLIDVAVVVNNGRPPPDRVVWNFGNGVLDLVTGVLDASSVYDWPGPYTVSAQLYRNANAAFHDTVTTSLEISAGMAARQVARAAGALITNELLVVSIAILLAGATGVLQLYVGKPFGTVEDYLVALLWGFGIEKSIRGFAAVYAALNATR